jgi:2'-5' RNA ligase/GNAT superfamily N-acetyltransferase
VTLQLSQPERSSGGRPRRQVDVSRRLFAVALLPPRWLGAQVDVLRAGLGDPRLADLPTHLTLVPPIDLDDDGTALLAPTLRAVARGARPFTLGLGPADTFAPRTMTLHLRLLGDLAELTRLRDALRVPPLDRPDEHDFVPHVTLLQRAAADVIEAGVKVLHESLGEWPVTSVHLLERLRLERGSIWHPVAEEPLGGPDVVGRGGVELHLRTIRTLEPAVADLAAVALPEPLPTGEPLLVVVAELPGAPGAPVGAAIGRASEEGAVLDRVAVADGVRRHGIARQVVQQWCAAAAGRGAGAVVARRDPSSPPLDAAVAEALGFVAVRSGLWVRQVGPPAALSELGSPP